MTAAAVDVYARSGWERFSIAAAAQEAGVGKSAGYLRWSSKTDLLAEALEQHGVHVQEVDTGSLRSDLITLGMALYEIFVGPAGVASLRLRIDALVFPELAAIQARIQDTQVAAARNIVRRGIARGEIPAATSIGLVLNAVCGGVTNNIASTPQLSSGADMQRAERFCEHLVDLVLSGIRS